jgi:hypothetical protein
MSIDFQKVFESAILTPVLKEGGTKAPLPQITAATGGLVC